MAPKASFDSVTRIVSLIEPPALVDGEYVVELDVKTDLYSAGLADWATTGVLRKMRFPIRVVGGDATPTGFLGATFFLDPAWKVKPYEASHRLKVRGNFYSEDGKSPFVKTYGAYNVFMEQTLSAIVERAATGTEKGRALDNFTVVMVDAQDHVTPKSGLAVIGCVSVDDGDFMPLTNPMVDAGGGLYRVNLTGAERNGDVINLRFVAAGADTRYITLIMRG